MYVFPLPLSILLFLLPPLPSDRPDLDPLQYFPPSATLNTPFPSSSPPTLHPRPSLLPAGTIETYVNRLRSIYCGGVGFEYAHLDEGLEKDWLRAR